MMQRTFDFICAAVGLPLLLPLLAAIALAIKVCDGGPVFYAQLRVGKDFKNFHLLKFRTMVPEAERHGLLTAPEDARVTRVGKFLRAWKLDELPQLLNVLMGDMQFVGARPEVERYVQQFPREYGVLLKDRPGITDPASLAYRHEDKLFCQTGLENQYISTILPDKLRLSLAYQQRRSFLSDLGILLHTLFPFAPTLSPSLDLQEEKVTKSKQGLNKI
ncbi:MAG: hypothetical protein DMG60_20480 [Acidobacteria bacterium]|nr:MAG: hypothetical protein DMG60_20480 [Acidobacteriota bacterium]